MLSRLTRYARHQRLRYQRDAALHPSWRRQRAALDAEARAYFAVTPARQALTARFADSQSTGAGWSDYLLLHRYILRHQPRRILECGSGVTTLVIAQALAEVGAGELVTLEDVPRFAADVRQLVSSDLASRVRFIEAPKRETAWRGLRGVRYDAAPDGPFDLVFVDGPTEILADGTKGGCLDLLFLLERQRDPLTALVDQKFSSLDAYQAALPPGRVRYDPIWDVGVLAGVSGGELHAPQPGRVGGGSVRQLLGLTLPDQSAAL